MDKGTSNKMETIISGLIQMERLLLLLIGNLVNRVPVRKSALPGDLLVPELNTQLSGIDPVQTKTTTHAALNQRLPLCLPIRYFIRLLNKKTR